MPSPTGNGPARARYLEMNEFGLDLRLARNRRAVGELANIAVRLPSHRWSMAPAPGKWTPAQHVIHVALAYWAMTSDVRDGRPADLIGSASQRMVWRIFGLSQVIWLGRIPPGARAPRELRPTDEPRERGTVLDELRAQLEEFDAVVRHAWRTKPGHRAAHPYFGALSLRQAIRVCEVHTRHHAALLHQWPLDNRG